MRGPLLKEGEKPAWVVLSEMFRSRRFRELVWPTSAAVQDKMTEWEQHTWKVLEKFSEIGAYSLLGTKLLKFYEKRAL